MNAYIESVIETVRKKHGNEPEFVQTVEEVLSSLDPVVEKHPEYEAADLLGRMVEPERMFTFRVVWTDDAGKPHTNIGYRCQFNGGSLARPEATGYGAVYYLQEVLKHEGESIEGKTIAAAGFGNVTWGICKKAKQLGAKVITLSGPDGYVYDPDGVSTDEKVEYLLEMRSSGRNKVKDYADKFGVEFHAGEKPWGVKADIIMPSAMQNDVNMEQAKKIAACGAKYYIEVANMPTTNDALKFLMEQPNLIVAPSKAVNAGGVGVSAMEMSQNSERLSWTVDEVDGQLKKMMENIHRVSAEAAEEYGLGYNLVAGANIAGFKKVAEAMLEQGLF